MSVAHPLPSETPASLHHPPDLASEQRILDRFADALKACGVVGEERNGKVAYLALTSRLLDEPVSLAVKGASASGKSFTIQTATRFFPRSAFIEITAMSERALVYMKEDFAHRTLVLYEAVALREGREKTEGNLTAYFVRSLLSEGRISYPVTVRDKDGNFTTRTIEKNGPTNLIVTTTATQLHGENETRLISLPTNDTAAQTRAVLLKIADGKPASIDFGPWHELQRWLEGADHEVDVPFAHDVAKQIPPVGVRLRRDFKSILRLVETHAMLHQASRARDEQGQIVATEDDYQVVRELVADLVAEGVGATVSPTMRQTVEAVRALANIEGIPVGPVAVALQLDRSAASRRLAAARDRGYLLNLEDHRGRPARYVLGEALPEKLQLLPHSCTPLDTASEAESAGQVGVCSDAVLAGGRESEELERPIRSLGWHPSSLLAEASPPDGEVIPPGDQLLLPTPEPTPVAFDVVATAALIAEERARGFSDLTIAGLLNTSETAPPPGFKGWTEYAVRTAGEST